MSQNATRERKRSPRPVTADGWAKRNDAGPHTATFPSGATLRFTIPNDSTLLAAGMLPLELRETALLCAAHPDGVEGYLRELVVQQVVDGEARVRQAIEHGIEMRHHLVAAMLVEPQVTAEQVSAGSFPTPDIEMLLEFATRQRNVDAGGRRLPIIVAHEWALFRDEPASANGAVDSDGGGADARADVPDADGGPV